MIESEETFFKESFKGREVMDKKAKKREGIDENVESGTSKLQL